MIGQLFSRLLVRNFFCLIFLAALLAPTPGVAFTLISTDSSLLGWSNPEVAFYINTSNCPTSLDVVTAFKEAAEVWNGVPTSNLKVSYGGSTTSTGFTANPTVYCESNFATVTGLDQDFTVGAGSITTSSSRPNTGILILNVSSGTGNISNQSTAKLRIIMAHEIGHVLGLGHADDATALMYYDATAKTTLRLSQDDIDGISYLYPRDELGSDKKFGCGLVRDATNLPPMGGSPTGAASTAALFALVMTVWWGLRKPKQERLHALNRFFATFFLKRVT